HKQIRRASQAFASWGGARDSIMGPAPRWVAAIREIAMPACLIRIVAVVLACVAINAPAQEPAGFPQRSTTLVVPFPPGGSMDALARIVGTHLATAWGKPVIVENRAGAGGLIGARHVKEAAPDGYTLLVTNSALVQGAVSTVAGTPPYDPIRDFSPVMHMTLAPVVFCINPRLPANTLAEYVALVKREPGKHSFGSGGVNQTLHLLGAVFNEAAGLDMAHVAFKGDAALVGDIVAGHVSSGFATIATAGPLIEAGKLRPLAVAGPRSPLLPGVPGFEEVGYPQLGVVGWFGMFAPAGTPRAVVDKIARQTGEILKSPDVSKRLTDMALTPTAIGPDEFGRIVARDLGYWDGVMKKVGEK
ncbi:MAG: tripartite tricarboxylate transporter substrate binding protein, partial [Thermomicrobiales bacterium]